MKIMLRLTTSLLVCLSLVCGAVTVFAAESVCRPQEPGSTVIEIAKWYEKYKSNETLVDAYLKGVAHGFEFGVQGSAAHIPISFEMTEVGAGMKGFEVGYHHGLAVYCSMVGRDAKYRKP